MGKIARRSAKPRAEHANPSHLGRVRSAWRCVRTSGTAWLEPDWLGSEGHSARASRGMKDRGGGADRLVIEIIEGGGAGQVRSRTGGDFGVDGPLNLRRRLRGGGRRRGARISRAFRPRARLGLDGKVVGNEGVGGNEGLGDRFVEADRRAVARVRATGLSRRGQHERNRQERDQRSDACPCPMPRPGCSHEPPLKILKRRRSKRSGSAVQA